MKKILRLLIINVLVILAMNGLHASVSSAEEKAVLKESVSTSAVQEELDSPDGVSIEVLSDGGWRIYGKGTGTYDLNDADEIRQGTKDAELRAKAAISKFLSEKIQSEEAVINLSLKVKNLNSGVGPKGESNIQVSKTDAQTRIEVIRSQSSAILAGVITLETKKTPMGNGGTISVILGVSAKSIALSAQVGKSLKEGLSGRSSAQSVHGSDGAKPASGVTLGGAADTNNKPEVKKSKTQL